MSWYASVANVLVGTRRRRHVLAASVASSRSALCVYTVCLKKTSPTFLAVTRESIVGFS